MTKTALEIAADFRKEALRHYAVANELITLSMICEGRHHSLPDDIRATPEESLAQLSPEQRAEYDRRMARWEARGR